MGWEEDPNPSPLPDSALRVFEALVTNGPCVAAPRPLFQMAREYQAVDFQQSAQSPVKAVETQGRSCPCRERFCFLLGTD